MHPTPGGGKPIQVAFRQNMGRPHPFITNKKGHHQREGLCINAVMHPSKFRKIWDGVLGQNVVPVLHK